MNRIVGFALVGGCLACGMASTGIPKPAAVTQSGTMTAEIAVSSETLTAPVAVSGLATLASSSTSQATTPRAAGAGNQALASSSKPAGSRQLVNPESNTPARPCAASLHGIVGPECPSK
jgi:hypothetical protein